MKKSSILMLALLFFVSAALSAQRPGGGSRPPGGHGSGSGSGSGTGTNSNNPSSNQKDKPADLAADSITAKWKDAKTLEITCTIKNMSNTAYSGSRTATLKFTGKDGKPETAKEESVPGITANGSHQFKVELTDKKYFDKDLKWTLEISAGDASASNDKKGPMTLSPGAQPKS
jgi:hypothetical protein